MKLKPLPKFLLILAVAGGAGYALKELHERGAFKSTTAVVQEAAQQPAVVQTIEAPKPQPAPVAQPAAPAPVQAPPAADPQPVNRPSSAGMSKLLEAKK